MIQKTKYYSQAGQDQWVLDLFKHKHFGYYIEVGAYDGKHLSNTLALEYLGWKGVCIEANHHNFTKLCENRPGTINVNMAVSDHNGTCMFNDNDMYGSVGDTGREMKCSTLESILQLTNFSRVIDYLSIDIEGYEYNALRVFPFDKYFIKAITVEHNAYNSGTENKDAIYRLLTENGFIRVEEVSADGLHFEDWYINKKLEI